MNPDIERRVYTQHPFAVAEIRANDNEDPVLTGYAAVFYREGEAGTEYQIWPDMIERIAPGAFDKVLAENQDVRALVNHDANHVLGRTTANTMTLVADETGLFYRIIPPSTQTGRDVMVLVERRDVTGSSFGFTVEEDGQDWIHPKERGQPVIRVIREISQLFDVGPVTFNAYDATTVNVRSADAEKHAQRPPKRDRRNYYRIKARAATV